VSTPDSETILAVLAERTGAEACLDAAYHASRALVDPRIVALHVLVDPITTIIPSEEILTREEERRMWRAEAHEAQALKAVYEDWRQLHSGVCSEWREVVGTEAATVVGYADLAVLLVIALSGEQALGQARAAFSAALFRSHRPVLMVPGRHQPRPVRRIVIGWKDSAVSRDAIRAAALWLRQAQDVQIVSVGAVEQGELAEADQLLAELGVSATTRLVPDDGASPGERLLEAAEGADWLVMGAYRHRRFVEWMFGGVTETVLDQANLPVFMVH